MLSAIPFATLIFLVIGMIHEMFTPYSDQAVNMVEQITDYAENLFPLISREWLSTNIINPGAKKTFTIFNLILLPIVSGLIFNSLSLSYRRIFRIPGHHIFIRHILSASVSIFIILLLFISNFMFAIFSPVAVRIVSTITSFSEISIVLPEFFRFTKASLISFVILMLFHIATVQTMLNIKIKRRFRFTGAFIFCGLWFIAKLLFELYVGNVAKIHLIYGSLSSVAIILMWIFYSSMILLFSIEVIYTLHTRACVISPVKTR